MILKPLMKLAAFVYRFGDRYGFDNICEASASFQESIVQNCPHPEPMEIGILENGMIVEECRLCGSFSIRDPY